MSSILETFQNAKEAWSNRNFVYDTLPENWTQNEIFHAAYHALNGVAMRAIHLTLAPESDPFGHVAVLLKKNNQFSQIEATDRGVEVTVWCDQENEDKIDEIIEEFKAKFTAYVDKITPMADKKDILKSLVVEEKIDEVINNTMNGENNRTVYFSVGKTREFAANIPLFMGASGANMIQLSMNKWMTALEQLRTKAPEDPIPPEKGKPLILEALKWKKWIMEFLDGPLGE
jgi:hypothetical protein